MRPNSLQSSLFKATMLSWQGKFWPRFLHSALMLEDADWKMVSTSSYEYFKTLYVSPIERHIIPEDSLIGYI